MTDFLVAAVLALIVGGAVLYIYKEKKRGVVCIGCPHAEACAKKHCEGGCGCHSKTE